MRKLLASSQVVDKVHASIELRVWYGSHLTVQPTVPSGLPLCCMHATAQAAEVSGLQPLVYGAVGAVLVGDPQQLPATVFSAAVSLRTCNTAPCCTWLAVRCQSNVVCTTWLYSTFEGLQVQPILCLYMHALQSHDQLQSCFFMPCMCVRGLSAHALCLVNSCHVQAREAQMERSLFERLQQVWTQAKMRAFCCNEL